jgi:hypothetical protein
MRRHVKVKSNANPFDPTGAVTSRLGRASSGLTVNAEPCVLVTSPAQVGRKCGLSRMTGKPSCPVLRGRQLQRCLCLTRRRNQHGFSLPLLRTEKRGTAKRAPEGLTAAQAVFFAVLTADCGVFFAFSLAANSCLILAAMASLSTL